MEHLGLRPEVATFARAMERQLRANDHKPGWKADDSFSLYERMVQESRELLLALAAHKNRGGMEGEIMSEAADIGNFAMMVADVTGALLVRAGSIS